jgi:hypothetical protein
MLPRSAVLCTTHCGVKLVICPRNFLLFSSLLFSPIPSLLLLLLFSNSFVFFFTLPIHINSFRLERLFVEIAQERASGAFIPHPCSHPLSSPANSLSNQGRNILVIRNWLISSTKKISLCLQNPPPRFIRPQYHFLVWPLARHSHSLLQWMHLECWETSSRGKIRAPTNS